MRFKLRVSSFFRLHDGLLSSFLSLLLILYFTRPSHGPSLGEPSQVKAYAVEYF